MDASSIASLDYQAPEPEVFMPALAAWPAANPDQLRRQCSRWPQRQP
jgi:hypothetical protein